eukprot:1149983-Pelagomonas_calceolata.AAC.1
MMWAAESLPAFIKDKRMRRAEALLRKLFSTLVTKIRHGLLLVTILIPIDFFVLFLLVKGIHGASALGTVHPLHQEMKAKGVQWEPLAILREPALGEEALYLF